MVRVGDHVTVLRVRKDCFVPAAVRKLELAGSGGGSMLLSAFWALLGPLAAFALYWFLNSGRQTAGSLNPEI